MGIITFENRKISSNTLPLKEIKHYLFHNFKKDFKNTKHESASPPSLREQTGPFRGTADGVLNFILLERYLKILKETRFNVFIIKYYL